MDTEAAFQIVGGVATALLIAGILASSRFLLQLRDLVQKESRPNGGSSAKDHMERTTRVLERLEREQGAQRLVQETQTQLLEDIRDEMKDHNRLTSEMVGAMVERR